MPVQPQINTNWHIPFAPSVPYVTQGKQVKKINEKQKNEEISFVIVGFF
jgi:hypothetical protein